MKKIDQIMKEAEVASKQDFLRFVTGIYGVDETIMDHIWDVPVIASYESDSIIETTLSTKSEDEILDILDDFIDGEIGEQDGCFIPLDKMAIEFEDEEIEEWRQKLERGEIQQSYNAIIVYNQMELARKYKEFIQENEKKGHAKRSEEEIEKIFGEYAKKVITHERCHLNGNYLISEVTKSGLAFELVNGSEMTPEEVDEILFDSENTKIKASVQAYANRNEVLIDTLAQMMSCYEEGDTPEDCLYKVIEKRDGKSQYTDFDDKEVLVMYTLFTDELTEWATFGAYDFVRENKLINKIKEVCGSDAVLYNSQLDKKVEEYISSLEEGTLSEKQIEMLEMLGVSVSKKIDKKAMAQVATSEVAMKELDGSARGIKAILGERYTNGKGE